MSNQIFKKNYYLLVGTIFIIPIYFIPNSWDSVVFDYAFAIKDLSGIKIWYEESSSNFQLLFINFLFFLNNFLNIPHEFLFDTFTAILFFLFCYEVKKYSEIVFELNKKWSNLTFILAAIFPVWHNLTPINLGLYLLCFYLALLGYRLFINYKFYIKFIGILIIICSFSIKSNFAFIIALSLAHNSKLFFDKKMINKFNFPIILFISILAYLVNINFFPPYGLYEDYNKVVLGDLNFLDFIRNFYNFLTFFIYSLWLPVFFFIYLFFFKKDIYKNFININKTSDYLAIALLFLVSIGPYLLVQKSTDLFSFVDYEGRHAFTVSLSFSIFFTIIIKKIFETFYNKKIYYTFVLLFILQNMTLLSLGYYAKFENSIIQSTLTNNLKKINEPSGGYVYIISNEIKTLRSYEIGHIFYKAYNKAAWSGIALDFFEFSSVDGKENQSQIPATILENNNYKTKYLINDFNPECKIILKLENELNQIDRLKKLYIFNKKKYFKIDSLQESC